MPNRLALATSIAALIVAAAQAQNPTPTARLNTPATESIPSAATMDEVVVTGSAAPVYGATEAFSATKSQTRLLDTPQAVSVIPRKLIEDTGATTMEEVLQHVAGVSTGGYYGDWDYYRIRGFDASFTTYWDGLRGDYGKNVELFGAEAIEILKGPASSLYGQGPLGGLVNVVSKKPRPANFADLQFTYGSYECWEPSVDAGLVLNSEKTVYLRLNALYRRQDTFIDYVDKERVFIAPSLTWEIGPDTKITFLTSYVHDRDFLTMPLPAKGTVLPNINGEIPISRYIGEPDEPEYVEQWRVRLGYQLTHKFNEVFSLRQNFEVSRMWQDWNTSLYPSSLDLDERTLYRYPYGLREELDRMAFDTALEARFKTGPVEHYLVGGFDYYKTDSATQTEQINYADFPGSYPALDLFSPNYGTDIPPYATLDRTTTKIDWWGLYIQEHAKIWDRFNVLLGGRYDISSSGAFDEEAFTGRVGLSYEVIKGVAVYANYSQSFNPQWNYRDALGVPVEPETGENWEAGIKVQTPNGKVTGTVSVFHLTRENLATGNLATPDPFDSIVSGEQFSQGIEVEGAIQLAPGWDFTLAYAYTDAEITADNILPVGYRLPGVPEHAISAWTKYTIQEGTFKGLGFGFGAKYYTAQEADQTYANPFKLPAYGLLDAAVYYDRGPFYARVNVSNLLDREYYVGAYNDLYVLPGNPCTVKATVGWRF